MAGQIALSIVLLTGAGLLVRTVDRLLDEESGFEPRQALTARLMLADTPFIDGTAQTGFVETLLERVRGLPGVQAAGVGSLLPPDDAPMSVLFVYTVEDDDTPAATPSPCRSARSREATLRLWVPGWWEGVGSTPPTTSRR